MGERLCLKTPRPWRRGISLPKPPCTAVESERFVYAKIFWSGGCIPTVGIKWGLQILLTTLAAYSNSHQGFGKLERKSVHKSLCFYAPQAGKTEDQHHPSPNTSNHTIPGWGCFKYHGVEQIYRMCTLISHKKSMHKFLVNCASNWFHRKFCRHIVN